MRQTAGVFLVSLLILAWGAGAPGIATSYVDPVAHILAQDEAVYASSSLGIAQNGGWLSPKFLGRWAFYKPPLLYWLSAICIKIAGFSAFAVRFPSILAGAAAVALIFAGLRQAIPVASALTAAVLLISSHLFFVLSRTGLCDALLIFEITLAMYALLRDPRLESAGSRWIFGVATGLGVMTKAVAGLLPLIILICAGVSLIRLAQVSAIAIGVAAPWHLWQLYAHPKWFWAEYFLSEHLVWGLNAPQQTTEESQVGFYAKRIFALDPLLAIAAVVAMIRLRSRMLIAWVAVVLASVIGWRYRNVAYMAAMYPAMAILAARIVPKRYAQVGLAAAVAMFGAKIFLHGETFGIPFAAESVNPAKAALEQYAQRHRGNDLIVVDPDDQFYSADLLLPHVRYVWITKITKQNRDPLDFEYLGVTVSAQNYAKIDQLRPMFAERMREFNLDSTEAVATVILAESPDEVRELIASHPHSDFYVSRAWTSAVHDVWATASGGRIFLLARQVIQRP